MEDIAMTIHDLKDLAMIYSGPNDRDCKVYGFDPNSQRKANLIFGSSSKEPNEINFIISYIDGSGDSLFKTVDDIIDEMSKHGLDMSINWRNKFYERLLALRGEC